MEPRAARRRRRAAAVVGLIASAAVPLAGAVDSVWTTAGGDLASVRSEESGARCLGPVVKLLVAVADAQSRAVRGTPSQPADLIAPVAAVDGCGLPQDSDPGTGTLWAQIRPRVLALPDADVPAIGAGAYQAYSEATDLILQQIAAVDDASGLVRDPAADAYHLVDALTVRLPEMAVEAGRFDDLVTLAAGQDPAARGASAARIAVVRDRIAVAAHAFATELDKVFRSTESATLGPHLLGDVDLVNTDVDALAPTASVIDEAVAIPSADSVAADRQAFDPAVTVLETAGLSELEILLAARESGYRQSPAHVLFLTACGAALMLPSAWWLARDRARTVRAARADEPEDRGPRPTARVGRRGSSRRQVPAQRGAAEPDAARGEPDAARGRPDSHHPVEVAGHPAAGMSVPTNPRTGTPGETGESALGGPLASPDRRDS